MDLLTKEQFLKVLPKKNKMAVSDKLVNNINNSISDPILREAFRENILSYTNVLNDGKYKIQSYIDAVKYVSYKLMGNSNIDAYTKTFPSRYQSLVNKGADADKISSYVAMYNKTQLVNKILEQSLVPSHILNAHMYQDALNTQAHLMVTANSEKVRCDAANSLLTHLKLPETQKIELDIGVKEDKSIGDLRNATMKLVEQQKEMLEAGIMTSTEIAQSNVITVEGELVED